MKSLEERKKQRQQQRQFAAQGKTPDGHGGKSEATTTQRGYETNKENVAGGINLTAENVGSNSSVPASGSDTTVVNDGSSVDDPLDKLTIPGLQEYVKSEGGEVPSNITKKEDVLAYAKNFRTAKQGASAGNGSGQQWQSGN